MLHDVVRSVLMDHLLLTEDGFVRAWETWEYLALVHSEHLEESRTDHYSDFWSPHSRRSYTDGRPVIGEFARARVTRPDSPLLKQLYGGDESRFLWLADRWEEKLMASDKYITGTAGSMRRKIRYDDQ